MIHKIRKFLCNVMNWHRPDYKHFGFDGASFCSTCKYCKKRIMQDSQGNGFTY